MGPLVPLLRDRDIGVTSRWWTPADARPSRTPSVRRAAADALDALGWTPQTEPDAIAYWIATEQWEKCSGDVAVGPLIDVLGRANERVCIGAAGALGRIADPRAIEPLITVSHEDCDDPKFTAAAEALVAMYHSGKLDDEARALVLAERDRIMVPVVWVDDDDFDDSRPSDQQPSSGRGGLELWGTGVDFPL